MDTQNYSVQTNEKGWDRNCSVLKKNWEGTEIVVYEQMNEWNWWEQKLYHMNERIWWGQKLYHTNKRKNRVET